MRGSLALIASIAAFTLTGCAELAVEDAPTLDGTATGELTTGGSAPLAGECRLLDSSDVAARSNDTDPVACTQPHTARTYHVGTVPEQVDLTTEELPEDDLGMLTAACHAEFEAGVGVPLSWESLLGFTVFVPNPAEVASGDSWYRCDLISWGEGQVLTPLPTTTPPFTSIDTLAERYRRCVRVLEEDDMDVPCDTEHRDRVLAGFEISMDGPYPGDVTVQERVTAACLHALPEDARELVASGELLYARAPDPQRWQRQGTYEGPCALPDGDTRHTEGPFPN